ncbi:MAG: hydrogenase maturation nickel metallochaperone HypA [Lachnospiraceae bacterium]|nr:hydrogenase maturation nickel metallochaperone HypA [Lachnospiraceae bacterium]
MSRYIDADKLQYELAEAFDNFDPNWLIGREIRQVILKTKKFVDKNATLDVQEVIHGKWLKVQNYAKCNVCNHEVNWGSKDFLSKFCPNCGAKMEK